MLRREGLVTNLPGSPPRHEILSERVLAFFVRPDVYLSPNFPFVWIVSGLNGTAAAELVLHPVYNIWDAVATIHPSEHVSKTALVTLALNAGGGRHAEGLHVGKVPTDHITYNVGDFLGEWQSIFPLAVARFFSGFSQANAQHAAQAVR